MTNAAFQSLIDALNPEQREAVEHIEGPVLVLAGPGTGKTHVLSARIGKILLETDARPQNILCLTFTDAGVLAMRKRLLDMIGPDAYRVGIFTFHAFCNRVIQENLEYFSQGELEPLSDLERIETVRNILAGLPPEHPLREGRKSAFGLETQLRNLFALMKREEWKPGFIQKQSRLFLEDLPNKPDFVYQVNSKYGKKGDLKETQAANMRKRMRALDAAADLFPKYEHALQQTGRYEYDDMLLWVIRAFEKHEALLRTYQERYLYFLVDEYQDTNSAQYHLLRQLLDYWDLPNVFVVGDDDQSIYEFQGARLHHLIEFYRQYQAQLRTIVLKYNYRSSQPILDAAGKVIEQNLLRAVNTLDPPLQKELEAALPGDAAPVLRVYDNRLYELSDVADRITALQDAGVPLREIAVLYAQHKQAERLLDLLQKRQIPYQTKRPVNILHLPLIRQLLDLLHYLQEEIDAPFSGDHRLFRILHAPFWEIEPLDLAIIALHLRMQSENDRPAFWRSLLSDEQALSRLQLKTAPNTWRHIAERLNQWTAEGLHLPPGPLLEHLLTQSGLLRSVLQHPDKVWWLQVLHTFQDFALRENARDPLLSLNRLLEMIGNMEANKLPLALQQTLQTGEGVQLLTVHAAKGLEFDHVFMIDCTEDYWEPSTRSGQQQFTLPDTLTLSSIEEDAMEARRRLFYVGMTRARKGLYISYGKSNTDGKALKPARFVAETGLPATDIAPEPAQLAAAQIRWLSEPPQPAITLPEDQCMNAVLDDFRLSITALNRYLRCPLALYYEDILRVPAPSSPASAFGQAMHYAVQQFFLEAKTAGVAGWPSEKVLTELFLQAMERRRGLFSHTEYDQRTGLGAQFLKGYHQELIRSWTRRAVVERHVDRAMMDQIPLTGTIDKIEWLDNGHLRVVDYKTGQWDRKKLAPPSGDQPQGGDFWRQLVFYKILLESADIYNVPVQRAAIVNLEPDAKGAFTASEIALDHNAVQTVREQIQYAWTQIQARQFSTGCGKPDCAWCRLHTERLLPERLNNMEEDLDDH
jgi:DNA helicase-2/ATP-dependent DNA helicase PcrA